jgi:hypothetical protein
MPHAGGKRELFGEPGIVVGNHGKPEAHRRLETARGECQARLSCKRFNPLYEFGAVGGSDTCNAKRTVG